MELHGVTEMTGDTRQRYDLTWRVTPDLLGVLGTSGRFEATNPAWTKTLGYTAEEIESEEFFSFIHPDDVAAAQKAFESIMQGEPVLNFRNRYRHKDGSYRWLSWNCVPEGGQFFCSARDISDHVDDRAALRSREDEARLREQFIAVLGHDLRNPLAAIDSALYLIGREVDSERGNFIISSGKQSVKRMQRLIDDLMDFARARLGSGLSLKMSDGSGLKQSLEHVISEISEVHPEVAIRSEFDLERPIRCDTQRLSQLASNLLANAVTHGNTDEQITLRAFTDADGLTIAVENLGEEIPENVRESLFEPFVREEARPSQEGLGLGLFIASQIAQSHGGRIEVQSNSELTRFVFEMPYPA